MDAEEFVGAAKFIESSGDGGLRLGGIGINGDGNKRAEVRLNARDRGNGFRVSGRPALAAA